MSKSKNPVKGVVLLIFVLFIAGAIYSTDIKQVYYKVADKDYRELVQFSEQQQPLFESALKVAFQNQEGEAYLKDLTKFEWDTVCSLGGYSHFREDISGKGFLGKDFPVLESFPNVPEPYSALVFVRNDKIIAVMNNLEFGTRYIGHTCGSKDVAKFKFVNRNAYGSLQTRKGPYQEIHESEVDALPKCMGVDCEIIFIGEMP